MRVPRIGVGVLLIRGDAVLLGKRKGSHGSGEYSFPGGHLEFNETILDCARRETLEETGLIAQGLERIPFISEDFFPEEDKHYVTHYVRGYARGKAILIEPEKCESWSWHRWDRLPEPLWKGIRELYESGYDPRIGKKF